MADCSPRLAATFYSKIARALAPTLVAALLGCARSPSAQAKEAASAIRSWDATLQLVQHVEAEDAIPDLFAKQARRAVSEGRVQAHAKLEKIGTP